MLTDLFEMILDERNDEALSMVKNTIQSVKAGNVDISELVISKSCKGLDAYENPDRMANVQAAKKMIEMGYDFIPGMKISWIVTDAKSTPQKVEPYISGVEFTAKPDYKYYAERLSQTASRITEVFGWEEKDLLMGNQQATLFSGKFESTDAPKKKKVEEKPKAKMKSLDDFF
jgi:DNA polymerase I